MPPHADRLFADRRDRVDLVVLPPLPERLLGAQAKGLGNPVKEFLQPAIPR